MPDSENVYSLGTPMTGHVGNPVAGESNPSAVRLCWADAPGGSAGSQFFPATVDAHLELHGPDGLMDASEVRVGFFPSWP